MQLLNSGVDAWLYAGGDGLAHVAKRSGTRLLADDLAVVAHPEVKLACAVFVEYSGDGLHALFELAGRLLVLDLLGLCPEVHARRLSRLRRFRFLAL